MKRVLQAIVACAIAWTASASRGEGRDLAAMDPAARAHLERIVRTRGFTRGIPRDAIPSPDGRRVLFLRSGPEDQNQILDVFEVATRRTWTLVDATTLGATGPISREEQARRERQRQTERGVTSFEISDDGRLVVVPLAGDLWCVGIGKGQRTSVRRLTNTHEPELDPHLSPDGKSVSFVRGNDLAVIDIATGRETTIARSDDPNVAWGVAEFVAQEEMGRRTGHWWSPDSRAIAFTRVDVTHVPIFQVPDFDDPNGVGHAAPYPKAGDPNAIVSLYVYRLGEGASPAQLDLGDDVEYLARVHWAPASDAVWVEIQPRNQARVDVRAIDLRTGASRLVLREWDRDWVNLNQAFHFLSEGKRFLWLSERSGHGHLEVIEARDGERHSLTAGAWDVTEVVDVDEGRGTVTFEGTRDGLTERHLYRVRLTGQRLERLSATPGWHEAKFHRLGHDIYAETFSDARTQPRVQVRRRDGRIVGELPSLAAVPGSEDLGPPGRFLRFGVAGRESLDVHLIVPDGLQSQLDGGPESGWEGERTSQRLPLIVYVYSGPGSQQVRNAWPGERGLYDSWLAERGFAVARIDGRGMAARGHDSERIFARRLGRHEIDDQVAGVEALLDRFRGLDPLRVGIWGWSYGGYATLMALARAPQLFRVGVAVAPVVDWRGYDSHYTERYLGSPSVNAAGYDSSSVLTWAPKIEGHLVLVHGTSDDNVHFRESMQLVQALQRAGRRFDLMVYPGTHMMQSLEERMHLYDLIRQAFAEHL